MGLLEDVGSCADRLQQDAPGVWRSLLLAERRAQSDEGYRQKYRQLVLQAVARVKAMDADVMTVAEFEQALQEYQAWYQAEAARRLILSKEPLRGVLTHQEWVRKWMPHVWDAYDAAYRKLVESRTKSSLQALRLATTNLFDKYLEPDGIRQGR
jgi:hypothetical protein